MGRLSASLLAFSVAAVLAVALSACGDSGADLLPGKTASEIEANLDEVARLANERECIGAEDAAQEVSAEVEALGNVDAELKRALSQGAARLNELVAGCEEEEPVEEELEPVEPEEEELEPAEKAEKPKKSEKPEKAEKPEKEEAEVEEPQEEEGNAELPPQANGKGKGLEDGKGPTSEGGGTPAGGVAPSTPVEGE